MGFGRPFVLASVMASACVATSCDDTVDTPSGRALDASGASDASDATVASSRDATLDEGDAATVDVAVEAREATSGGAIEAGLDASEAAVDAGTDGADAAAVCGTGTTRCFGRSVQQCNDAGAWVGLGLVPCYYGCYGAGICSGASCPSSCASDTDCVSCPQTGPGTGPYCCDTTRGVCNQVSAGCPTPRDAGPE